MYITGEYVKKVALSLRERAERGAKRGARVREFLALDFPHPGFSLGFALSGSRFAAHPLPEEGGGPA